MTLWRIHLAFVQFNVHMIAQGDRQMEVLSYSDARKNLKSVMDKVVEDRSEAIITRRNGEAVVMVSLSEWNSIMETEYLLRSPENARRLRESIAQLDRGEGVVRELIQP